MKKCRESENFIVDEDPDERCATILEFFPEMRNIQIDVNVESVVRCSK